MNKNVVVDTNILIAFYNQGKYEDDLLSLNRNKNLHISAITLNEFIRGAHDPVSKQIVSSFLELIQGKVITPTEKDWIDCAKISEQLLVSKKRSKENILLLQNDILIALGTKANFSTLITTDKDFELIRRFISIPIEWW